jgi:enoyl-CoA hydratase/carnithine racemase
MMLLTGDYRIAGDDLRTGLSAVKYSIIPGSATYRLAAAIGTLNARRLCLFTEFVDAPEAFRLGLVDRVVPAARVAELARETAQRVTRFSPTALEETKRLLAQAASLDLASFERVYLEAQQRCLDAGDIKPWNKLDHRRD